MASPFNPFGGGRGQRGASTTQPATGRGQGAASGRGSQFQPRGSSAPRGKWNINRGRGAQQSRGRGRGRGAGAGATATSHIGTQPSAGNSSQSQATNSPFAQLNQNKAPPNPFGALQAQKQSPFAGIQNASAPQIPPQSNQAVNATGRGLRNVPVEDAAMQSRYHERYDQLKLDRAKQRQQAIKAGQMADPNQPTSLNKAITPVGTCNSMCPEFERVERLVQKMVDKSEKFLHPSTGTLQNMETKMLKRFRRSAAGYDEQLPSDIRTPEALLQTMNYLIRNVIGGSEPLGIIHKFVWDRTRSIRNDFSVQQVTHEKDVKIAVKCLERIARFHILSLHLLSSPANEEPFDRHQEREQLNNTMLSLMYYYDDNRGRVHFPNEDEFRAYYIIFSIHDQRPDLEARVSKWPTSLLTSPRVHVALELYAASCNTWEYQGTLDARRPNSIAQGFYARFFNIINSPSVSYLMACVAEIYFSYVRQTAIRAIWKGYCKTPMSQQHKNEEWTVDELTKVLHFDDNEQTIKFCEEQDLQFARNANGVLYLNWGNRPVDSIQFSPSSEHAYSHTCVEYKRAGRNLPSIILGMSVKEAARMGWIDKFELQQRTTTPNGGSDDSLFVSAEGNLTPAPVVETNTSSLDVDVSMEPSAPSVPNPFQKPLPSTNGSMLGTGQSSNPPSIFAPQTSNAPAANPFASMFSGGNVAGTAKETPAAGPFSFSSTQDSAKSPAAAAAPDPAPSGSVFSFSKPAEPSSTKVEQGSSSVLASSASTGPPSLFPSGGVFQPTSTTGSTPTPPNPFATPSSPFATPQSSAPTLQAAAPAIASNTQQSTPLVPTANPFFPSSGSKEPSPPAALAPEPSSLSSASKIHFGLTETANINDAQAQPPKPAPFANAESTMTAPAPKPESIFSSPGSTAATGPSASSFASSFNFANQAQNSFSVSKSSNSTPAFQSEGKPSSPAFGFSLGQDSLNQSGQKSTTGRLFAGQEAFKNASGDSSKPAQSKENHLSAASVFAPATTTAPLFAVPGPEPLQPFSTPSNTPGPVEETPKQSNNIFSQSTASQSAVSLGPPVNKPLTENNTQSLGSAVSQATSATEPPGLGVSAASLDSSLSSRDSTPSTKRKFFDGPPVYETEEEERAAWQRILKRVEEKQARKKAKKARQVEEEQKLQREQERERELEQARNRKRALEETALEQSSLEEPETKALRVSDLVPNSPPTAKYSFASVYAKPVPTLPCLERARELTERKAPADTEIEAAEQARRKHEIDQDEILLSAARIAAEQLKNGPKIFDGYTDRPGESRRFSYSPHASLSASTPYSQSMSPPAYPNHGYKVAYAPDTPLGLGRTMSRTEQRIRRTGAHGLAYIPLDFSKTYSKSSDEKNKFSQSQ